MVHSHGGHVGQIYRGGMLPKSSPHLAPQQVRQFRAILGYIIVLEITGRFNGKVLSARLPPKGAVLVRLRSAGSRADRTFAL